MLSKNDIYRNIFAKNLNYYMQINGKIQDDLVKDLQIKSSTISSWCNGQKLPRMDKIVMLSEYFGIHFSKLIEEKTNNNHFEFIAEDDAMFPVLAVGDTALVYKQDFIENGSTYLIKMNNKNTIRQIILNENKTHYKLVGLNCFCQTLEIPIDEISKIQILGKVVKAENISAFR